MEIGINAENARRKSHRASFFDKRQRTKNSGNIITELRANTRISLSTPRNPFKQFNPKLPLLAVIRAASNILRPQAATKNQNAMLKYESKLSFVNDKHLFDIVLVILSPFCEENICKNS